ncbi:hypothetical protein [Pseudoxanthomonas sp. X-1]|uniref:hypothetical protein n=1 Tax=Pseudoxanthomonas sp. X-1 TaxID=2571115 RepID=UPI00110B5BE6|nr:hypothetical protein [Pseudoxanthomonas sp. X-1]TMN20429.1 hypothetical protein FF950_08280 [Pseudoxanthomonas sp. X-1]UAY74679.1 hypothetical protein LAJ50_20020 [Pseudoxanthomonas sp. X-1]
MNAQAPHPAQDYRATMAARIGVGVLVALLLALCAAGARAGSLGLMVCALVPAGLLVAGLWRLRLTLDATSLQVRTLFGVRRIALAQVARAWLSAPRGIWSYGRAVPMLGLAPRQGPPLVIGLQALPHAALVELGRRLVPYGVRIEVADTPAARRLARRIWQLPKR